MPKSAMIFAAGFGTRMGHLTKDRPKPLIKVAGKTLLDWAIEQVDMPPIEQIVVNAHYHADQIEAHLTDHENVTVIHENPQILETGGGLKNALPLLGPDAVVAMNSDAVWAGPKALSSLLSKWDPKKMDGLLLLVPRDLANAHNGHGDFDMSDSGTLHLRAADTAEFVYIGLQIIKTDQLATIEEKAFSINLLWQKMMRQDRLFGAIYDGHWFDVGHPDGIGIAEDFIAKDTNV